MGWIGDGATAEGDFHSAMTFAAVYQAPVSWPWSTTSGRFPASPASPAPSRRPSPAAPIGYGIAGLRVDGNDALAVYAAVSWAAERARTNKGPTLIEFFTYRAEGHSTSDDPTGYRPKGEAEAWPLGDPIARLKAHLVALGEWDDERDAALDKELDATVRAAQKEAEKHGHPAAAGLRQYPVDVRGRVSPTRRGISPSSATQALDEAREYLGHEPK